MEKITRQVFLVKEKTLKFFGFLGTTDKGRAGFQGHSILYDGGSTNMGLCPSASNSINRRASSDLSAIKQALDSSEGQNTIELFLTKTKNGTKTVSIRIIFDEALVRKLSILLPQLTIRIQGRFSDLCVPFGLQDLKLLKAVTHVECIDGAREIIRSLNRTQEFHYFCVYYNIILEWDELRMSTRPESSPLLDRLFREKLLADCCIVAGDGTQINCHQNVLSNHSDVFLYKLTHHPIESQTKRIGMGNIDGTVLNFLVNYLYGQHINVDDMGSGIALQLLYTAHDYHISSLKDLMVVRLFQMDGDTFDIGIALAVYVFTLRNNGLDFLMERMLNILKRDPRQLLSSPAYQRTMREDPNLCTNLLLKIMDR